METYYQYQNHSPNPNQEINNHQLNDSLYLKFSDYFTFEDVYQEDILTQNVIGIGSAESFISSNSSSNMQVQFNARRREKKYKTQKEFRFVFKTKSNLEIMDDGYKWRKYGKKKIKNSHYPRNYFKCSNDGCNVKKRVERDREDPRYVMTTYQGVHNHQI